MTDMKSAITSISSAASLAPLPPKPTTRLVAVESHSVLGALFEMPELESEEAKPQGGFKDTLQAVAAMLHRHGGAKDACASQADYDTGLASEFATRDIS